MLICSHQSANENNPINAYILVFFFGSGLIIANAGINFFSTNDMLKYYGWKSNEEIAKNFELTAIITSCFAMLCSRIPTMFDKFSAEATQEEHQDNSENHAAQYVSLIFTTLGYIGGTLSGFSMCYLGGNTIATHLKFKGIGKIIFLLYMAISSTLSYWIYSVTKVKKSSYQFGLMIFNRNNHDLTQQSRNECITLILTIIVTFLCVTSSCKMFYFLNKNSIAAFLDSIYFTKVNENFQKILAGILVIPMQSTLIFSQIAQVNQYIKNFHLDKNCLLSSSLKGRYKLLFLVGAFINLLSIPFQGMLYNYYTIFLFQDLKMTGGYYELFQNIVSLTNTLSSTFVYYVFTVEPAIKYLARALEKFFGVNDDYTVLNNDTHDTLLVESAAQTLMIQTKETNLKSGEMLTTHFHNQPNYGSIQKNNQYFSLIDNTSSFFDEVQQPREDNSSSIALNPETNCINLKLFCPQTG